MRERTLRHRRIGRRLACLGLVAGAASALAGCGNGALVGAESAARGLRNLTPPPRGTLAHVTWDLPSGEPTTLDPVKTGDYSPNTVVENLCDDLMRIEPDFSVRPGLVRHYSRPNPRTIVLDLRHDVHFWDGHLMTSADVVFSMKRNMTPADEPVNASVYARVRSITATGRFQVTVRFRRPDSLFMDAIAGVPGAINEKAYVQRVGKAYGTAQGGVMCSGPFRLVRWTPGQDIQLAANPHYWDRSLRPRVKRLTFDFITDDSTLTSALLTGAIDGSYEVPTGELNAFRHSSKGTLYAGPTSESLSLAPMHPTGPSGNPLVRRALDLAIDKRVFATHILDGAGRPLSTFTAPYVWQGSPQRAIYRAGYDRLPAGGGSPADIAQARRLIQQAHVGHAMITIAIAAGDEALLQLATITQAAGERIGLRIRIRELQPTPYSNLFYETSARRGLDFIATEGYVEIPSPLYYAPSFVYPHGLFNWTGYDNPTATRWLQAAQSSLNPVVSARDFVRAQAVFGPADLQISIAVLNEELFMNNRLTGAPSSFAYISSPWAARLGAAR